MPRIAAALLLLATLGIADEAPVQRKVMEGAAAAAAADTWTPSADGAAVALRSGVLMPRVGFGCASNIHERELVAALSAGFRFFDTARSAQWGYDEPALAAAL